MSAETAMWWSDGATRRSEECVVDALADREALLKWWAEGVVLMTNMRERHITYCSHGCVIDLESVVEACKPDSAEIVAARARELAADREAW